MSVESIPLLPSAAARAEPTLSVRGLEVRTAGAVLVHNLDLEIAPGERVGLIGESGSGKSMTATAIMGLLPDGVRADGSVRLRGVGHELLGASERSMSRLRGAAMSMVFQEPMTALNPLMKVGRQVAEVLVQHRTAPDRRVAARRAVELLATVRLPDPATAAQAYPHQLSGGQRQRVMLALALPNDPALLLCDEPTTALDVTVQAQVLALVDEAVRVRDTSLLFITHDLAVVASVCERVLVMNAGRIVERGPIDRVFTAPEHPYTRGLLRASDLGSVDARGRLHTVGSSAGGETGPGGARPGRDAASSGAAWSARVAPAAGRTPPRAPREHQVPGDGPEVFTPAGDDALIRVRDLTRVYQRSGRSLLRAASEVTALRGVSFDVRPGERFGIVGESGSGKSTLLRLLCGLDQPTSGTVRVAGTELAGAGERELRPWRSAVQIVFQDPMGSLDPRMRVGDIVSEPLDGVGRDDTRARVRLLLESVGLPAGAADRHPHQFSGGQRQRISIARALITRPRILVADEPVSALDVSVRAQVLNLLAELVDEYELTLVFVSHDLGVVRHVCDTVAVMHDGQIVEAGPTGEVYDAPRHPYTRELVAATPTIARALAGGRA